MQSIKKYKNNTIKSIKKYKKPFVLQQNNENQAFDDAWRGQVPCAK